MPASYCVHGNPENIHRQGAEVRASRTGARRRPGQGMKAKRDPWPEHCRRQLIAAILAAADLFPHSGEDSGVRIHDSRKALKEARAAAKLFAVAVGPTAYEAVG